MTQPSAEIILDSISPAGYRLTTMKVVMHRFVLAEFNTHRAFSRNSASSRAIPIEKMIEKVLNDPAMPLKWGSNKPGMQAGEEIEGPDRAQAIYLWYMMRNQAVDHAKELSKLGVHKQIANRLLEPFLWHTAIVSATEWNNFFEQRASPECIECRGNGFLNGNLNEDTPCGLCGGRGFLESLAQPEIVAVADAMRKALKESKPVERKMHLPFLDEGETTFNNDWQIWEHGALISTARCARVSYLQHDGYRDIVKDIELANKLRNATPPHMSPFEHVAEAMHYTEYGERLHSGNFRGWKQYRHEVFGR